MILRKIVFIQLILIQVILSSCAYVDAQRDDVDSLITRWITEQEFDKATNTLLQVKTTHPQYLKLMLRKNEITKKSDAFVKTTIKQAKFFIKENKWEDAYTVYTFALSRVSEDKILNASYKYYLQKRQIYVTNLKHEILINNARHLINVIPVQHKIALAIKETSVEQDKVDVLHKKSVESVAALITCSSDSIALKKLKLANTCINLALKLKPSNESLKQLKQNQLKIKQLTAGKKQRSQQAKSNSQSKLLKEYKAAFEKNDLYTANKKLSILIVGNKDNYELSKLKATLEKAIDKKITTGIESGRILYSKGNIKLALDKWQRLQKLDPENVELKSHISRAERVLRKLHTLTNKGEKIDG